MLKISYEQLQEDIFQLARKIQKELDLSKVDLVSISRGGLFVGGLLSYLLELKRNRVICLESYQDNHSGANPFMKEILDLDQNLDSSRVYLFVDDVNDTGQTCGYIKDKMKHKGLEAYFASVYNKTHTKTAPDFFGRELLGDAWIEFPWDKAVEDFKTNLLVQEEFSMGLLELGLDQILEDDSYDLTSKKQ